MRVELASERVGEGGGSFWPMAHPDKPGPGPLPALVGGVIAALVLVWFVGLVIGTITFILRIAVFVGLVAGVLWLWSKFSSDD